MVAPGFNPVYRNIIGNQRWPIIVIWKPKPNASKMETGSISDFGFEMYDLVKRIVIVGLEIL